MDIAVSASLALGPGARPYTLYFHPTWIALIHSGQPNQESQWVPVDAVGCSFTGHGISFDYCDTTSREVRDAKLSSGRNRH